MKFLLLLIPIAGLILMILIHLIKIRIIKASIATSEIFKGFLAGAAFLVLAIIIYIINNFSLSSFLNSASSLFFYCILAYCYYHFVNISEASIRLRFFAELNEGDDVTISKLEDYQQDELPYRRIKRLLASGDLCCRNNVFVIGKKRYVIAASILQFVKCIIGITKKETIYN